MIQISNNTFITDFNFAIITESDDNDNKFYISFYLENGKILLSNAFDDFKKAEVFLKKVFRNTKKGTLEEIENHLNRISTKI